MRIQYQNPRDYVDLLLCSELTFGMYQDKRRERIIFMLILCCLIKKYSKNQDSLLFNANSTFHSTNESRPQALWILSRFIEIEF